MVKMFLWYKLLGSQTEWTYIWNLQPCQIFGTKGLYYKTFYDRNLWILKYVRVFAPGEVLQPSLVFEGKVGAYPREAPFRCSTLV